MSPELARLNSALESEATQLMTPLVERSEWVVRSALDARPFGSDECLAQALVEIILSASRETRLALFNAHPELGGLEATSGKMTRSSTGEQGRLGLHALSPAESTRLTQLNAHYQAKFRHPFIVALHRIPNRMTLFSHFENRLKASPVEEHVATLAEITSVIRSRCRHAFGQLDVEIDSYSKKPASLY